jgi:hypothetical protein
MRESASTRVTSVPRSFHSDANSTQRVVAGDDALAIDLDPRQALGVGAGGDHKIGCLQGARAGCRFDRQLLGRGERAGALDDLDLVLLHQELQAFE